MQREFSQPAADPVVITGLGVISALGTSAAAVSQSCREGVRPFDNVRAFDASAFRVNLAAEAPPADFTGRFGRAAIRNTSRTDRLALWAADDAFNDAGMSRDARKQCAVFVGASTGGMRDMEKALAAGGPIPLSTYWSYPVWSGARAIDHVLGASGPRATYMTACSSAAHALGLAMRRLRQGTIDTAIAGGCEAMSQLTLAGFGSLGVLDPTGCRPFCTSRGGITLGEGAAFFVLERLSHAVKRDARPLAILSGYGASADAHHMVHPKSDGSGALLAMRAALDDAGVPADAVDYVNAHGTGTKQNDAMESAALATLFEGRPPEVKPVAVASSKSMLGHTLGAAAAMELAVTILGMRDGFTPASLGVTSPLPLADNLHLVQGAEAGTTRGAAQVALSSSFAFGGNNAALLVEHPSRIKSATAWRTPRPAPDIVIAGAALTCPRGTAHSADGIVSLLDQMADGRAPQGLQPGEILGKAAVRRMDPLSALSSAIIELAWQSAAGDVDANSSEFSACKRDAGIIYGTSFGALDATAKFLRRLGEKGPTLVNPLEFPNLVHNAPVGYASIQQGSEGYNVASCQEELAGHEAYAAVCELLRERRLTHAVAAGGDLQSELLDEGSARISKLFGESTQHAGVIGAVLMQAADAEGSTSGVQPWARVLGTASVGRHDGLPVAVERVCRRNNVPDLWCTSALTDEQEEAEVALCSDSPCHGVPRMAVRRILGDAAGSGPAVIAMAAALIATGAAETVLVTATTHDGAAFATMLGKYTL